jgi:branched-chain amino acid transport system permease protein
VLGWDLTGDRAYVTYAAVVFCVCLVVVVAIRRSRFGLRLVAIKDAPVAVATTGTDAARVKLAAFALSGALAGVGGAILGGAATSISSDGFGLFAGLPILLLMVVLGVRSPVAAIATGVLVGGTEVMASLPLGPFEGAFEGGGVAQAILIGGAAVALARTPGGIVPWLQSLAGRTSGARSGEGPDFAPELVGLDGPADAADLAVLDRELGLVSSGSRHA